MTEFTLAEAVGQTLVVGFEGTTLTPGVRAALSAGRVGGVILFRRNIEDLEQVVELNHTIGALAEGLAPWSCIDQEGGLVRRLTEDHGVTSIPTMRSVGEANDEELATRVGEVIGRELAAVGFNVDFAPVVDVDTVEGSFIGSRSFGSKPELVGRMGRSIARGLANAGVVACAKHFPGHGGTVTDSHLELPVIEASLESLESLDLVPFRMLFEAHVPMVMTAHILFPALDAQHPATLSPRVLQGLLREQMGYGGVVVSDDLEMAAVAARYSVEEMVTLGVEAGVDVFLVCRTEDRWQEAFEVLLRTAERDGAFAARVRASARRVRAAKLQAGVVPYAPAQRWRERIASVEHAEVMAPFGVRLA